MDFKFTPEQDALRQEFKSFFKEEEKRAPAEWVGGHEASYNSEAGWAYHRSVAEKLAKKGWLSLPWPRKYGGKELGFIEQAIFNEEWAYHRVPGFNFQGLLILVPSLLEYGSEEIKTQWLPPIARAEMEWCQGWSEPNAGSDLAALTTRAVEDGDDYVINGQKIWTTGAQRATHIFILARTDPNASKHAGLTYFITEMNRPGITVRPLLMMDGTHVFNEVFLDNLRVPKKNIVGKVNQGWYVSMAGANFERSGSSTVAGAKRDLEDLVRYCQETQHNGRMLARDPLVRYKLAELAIQLEAARQWAYYCSWVQGKNTLAMAEPSASKFFSTELMVRLANTSIEIMGLYGTLKRGSKWAPLQGKFESMCQFHLGLTIAAGSTEVQKNLIAWTGLKLPRN
ncbi:MAG: acyl-CoA dehydrogenase family protein [Chloroflexi bacterium]|nr:acyl-CoA dehydrogenase family protein [Chloroflexota bacterium]